MLPTATSSALDPLHRGVAARGQRDQPGVQRGGGLLGGAVLHPEDRQLALAQRGDEAGDVELDLGPDDLFQIDHQGRVGEEMRHLPHLGVQRLVEAGIGLARRPERDGREEPAANLVGLHRREGLHASFLGL